MPRTPATTLKAESGHIFEELSAHNLNRSDLWSVGQFGSCRLKSAFQPIFCLSHPRPVGYEGLVRTFRQTDGSPISPQNLFAQATDEAEVILIDRLCRMLHILNFQAFAPEEAWLFLNLNPQVVLSGHVQGVHFTTESLARSHLETQRVVIEILEKEIPDEGLLMEAMTHYRERGYLTAIDDFGAGQSNFDRIWRLQPDIVKLDRSIIVNSASNPRARRVLPSLVSLIHEAGCLVLIEGIETREEALISMDSDVDLVQGYYFGRPASDQAALDGMGGEQVPFLTHELRTQSTQDAHRQLQALARYLGPFWSTVQRATDDATLLAGCDQLLQQPGVVCCFILDGEGRQMGPNRVPTATGRPAGKYHCIAGFSGADWSRRSYFRRAVARPGEVQIMGPYLSLPDAHMSITLSLAVGWENGTIRVVCVDLDWTGSANIITGSMGPFFAELAGGAKGN
ncbi:MAG: EAL domain-containing protein [Magnetococcales bacterium]|nr:EAL domain-containing protein [Magnetococcales bacterium]